MPAAWTEAALGMGIAGGLLALAAAFAWRQWIERAERDDQALSPEDARYFAGKDRRRLLGSALLALMAVGMTAGLAIDPRANRRSGELFVWIWAGVTVLVLASMLLALRDWWANAGYARRHRHKLLMARRVFLEQEIRRRRSGDGPTKGREPMGEG